MPAWKVASGEISGERMFDAMSESGWPMFVSTGMAGWDEIRSVVKRVQERGAPLTLFQCTTAYPTPLQQVGLNVLQQFRDEFACSVGLSDHSGEIFPGLAAVTMGIDAFEAHITWHRSAFGPDNSASLTIEEFALLTKGVRAIETMKANPVDKDQMASQLQPLKEMFGKSLVVRKPIRKGELVQADHLTLKKPGNGIPETRLQEIVGRPAMRDLALDELIMERDVA